MNKKLKEYRADLLLLSVAIAWGVTFLIVQDAVKSVPVYAFLFYRFLIATILMFVISWSKLKNINKKNILYGSLLGLALFSGFATQTFGLTYTQSSIVAFITGFNVIFVPFLAYVFFKDIVRKNVLLGSFIAFAGLYFLTMSGELSFKIGEFLSLACALMFAIHIILTGKFSSKEDVFLIVCFQFLTVTVLSLVFSLFLDEVTFNIEFDYTFLKAVIITSLFATVYAFLIQTYFQQYTTASKTAIIFTMEPLSAFFYGVYVGNEVFSSIQLFGALLIILATLISEIKFKNILKHSIRKKKI